MAAPKAVIVGCEGHSLSQEERRLFASHNPFGLILFARNIDNPGQVTALTNEFRACVGRADAPVLIDQEGGRVARLRPPHWDELPPAATLGALYRHDPVRGVAAAKLLGRLLAAQLRPLGITVDCTPVLDLGLAGKDKVIGDRAFGNEPKVISALARGVCDGLRVGSVLPVIKHIPGHGRAMADSHEELPVVDTSLEEMNETDFAPFKALHDMPLAMTAHILYTAIDRDNCATLSPKLIQEVIREQIRFEGLLMSDDICMKALKGDLPALATSVLEAGCDLALYCRYEVADLSAILAAVPPLSIEATLRWDRARKWVRPMDLFDPKLAQAEFQQLLSNVA